LKASPFRAGEDQIKPRVLIVSQRGVQEETCILGVPCVTLRENTERPETLRVGSNLLVGTDPVRILEGVKSMMKKEPNWKNPFGDGKVSKRIVDVLLHDPSHP